ncbi:MAG: FAD-binding protein [Anaerolineae bacterium]|nr:FAD-binding protein [Anaerolineae bacterium]
MSQNEVLETDVIIVGAGGARMRAAIAAADEGARVIVITKGQAARSGATPMACPSYQAAFAMEDDRDNPEIAFEDTCFEGRYLGDENLIDALTHEATDRAMDMYSYGVKFRKQENGKFLQVVHPGHSFERNLVIMGNGYAMAAGLRREMLKKPSVKLLEDVVVTRLLMDDGRIAGLVGLDMRSGNTISVQAPTVILATGGYQEMWRWTDTEPGLTGEGVFLAYQVGADLVDLEMMLFYPAGLCYPNEVEGTLVQYEGLLTKKYCAGEMLNGLGEHFLPHTQALPVRDVMMKLMFREIEEGRGTPHGGVYIDLRNSPRSGEEIRAILTKLDSLPYDQLRDLGIDVEKEPIEVMPVTHYTLGGVRINEWAETTVEGLFAAGEVGGNIHGANRTSGNALAETQVFGRRAGIRAAQYALNTSRRPVDLTEVAQEAERLEQFLTPLPSGIRPIELKRKIKKIMHDYVHYRRNREGLQTAIEAFQQLRVEDAPRLCAFDKHRIYNYEWEEAIEAKFMIELGELIAASALTREESRGHHWRTDFPAMRPEWEKHTIVRKVEADQYEVSDAPVIRLKDRTKIRRTADAALLEAGVLEGYPGD